MHPELREAMARDRRRELDRVGHAVRPRDEATARPRLSLVWDRGDARPRLHAAWTRAS